jgi:DNA-binding FadR family transcriptional regulator
VTTARRWTSGEIAGELRRRILAGEIQPHAPVGPLRSIAGEFGVARGTAGLAVRQLTATGLITTRPGSGIYAADPADLPVPEAAGPEHGNLTVLLAAGQLASYEARLTAAEQLIGELQAYIIDLYARMGASYPGWPRSGATPAADTDGEAGTSP